MGDRGFTLSRATPRTRASDAKGRRGAAVEYGCSQQAFRDDVLRGNVPTNGTGTCHRVTLKHPLWVQ